MYARLFYWIYYFSPPYAVYFSLLNIFFLYDDSKHKQLGTWPAFLIHEDAAKTRY